MPDKITLTLTLDELKELDKNLYYCEETWSIFDKIKVVYPQPKMTLANSGEFAVVSYNYKLYYRFEYPDSGNFSWYKTQDVPKGYVTGVFEPVTDAETERLLEGLYYNHIVVKRETAQERGERVHNEMEETIKIHDGYGVVDYQPTPQTPEQVADGLKEAFREAVKQGVVSSTKPQTLYDVIADWWDDTFTKKETSLQELVDAIEEWLPKEQSAAGSQNAYVECTVEGFNDCLNKIKRKLR
mgnify:CR=1 FL=1